jgi:putative tricarboxylic transport membrane protein
MTLRVNIPDLAFAAFLVALGALAFALASELTVGTAAAMGPGYVPRGLAGIIMIYGVGLGLRAAFTGRQAFPVIAWRPLLLISAAVALFAVLLPIVGLALTSLVVVICSGLAAYDARLRENALLAVALAIFAVLLFVTALGLPIQVWPEIPAWPP